jgi:hypothetical protein
LAQYLSFWSSTILGNFDIKFLSTAAHRGLEKLPQGLGPNLAHFLVLGSIAYVPNLNEIE